MHEMSRIRKKLRGKNIKRDQDKTWISTLSSYFTLRFFCFFFYFWIKFEIDSFIKVYKTVKRQHQTLIYIHPPNWKQLINNLFVTWNEQFKLHVRPIRNHHKTVSNDHLRRINCDWLNFVFTKCLHLFSLKRYLESNPISIEFCLTRN